MADIRDNSDRELAFKGAGAPDEEPLGLLSVGAQAFAHSAIQSPLDGVTQLVNHVAQHEIIPSVKLIDAPKPAEFGCAAWMAETIGSGFGMVAPFLAVQGASSAMLGRAASIAERSEIGAAAARTLSLTSAEATSVSGLATTAQFLAPATKMALDGAIYGAVLTPSNDPNKNFWQQRGIAAASSALTFGAMGLASEGIMAGAQSVFKIPMSDPVFNLSAKGVGVRFGANALAGSIGGAVSAESNSLLSGNGFATKDELLRSMASFIVTGAALDGAHVAGAHLQKAMESAREREVARNQELAAPKLSPEDQQMLDTIEKAHFQYFKDESDPVTGLTKDRSRSESPASIAAVGFSLTAHGVAAERGWISRDEAADYTLKVLKNLWSTPQGSAAQGVSGDRGFFYHFLDPKTGLRAGENELSTIDTALLMSGVLFSKNFFDANTPKEREIRDLSTKLYSRVDWNWAMNESGRLTMGWTPEHGVIPADWRGYNEASILLLLGLGSKTHPIPAKAWDTYMSTDKVGAPYGHTGIEFGPMFGHQYTQIWVDFRNIHDATTSKLGFDYFENSRRAALAQHDYAMNNPLKWRGYGPLDWGLTASDGPGYATKTVDGIPRTFHGYSERGFPNTIDDGTIAPTAAAASLPFAPEIVLPTLRHWLTDRPEIVGPHGFQDAFNPTFDPSKPSGWVDPETLGIDQGPILLMTENYRNGFVWQTMRSDEYLNTALRRAGFSGRYMGGRRIGSR